MVYSFHAILKYWLYVLLEYMKMHLGNKFAGFGWEIHTLL